jgi:hypothetical protein
MQILLKVTKFVKGAREILRYPMSTSSKSTSFRIGLGFFKVGEDDTNSMSFSPSWYNAILEMMPLN